MGLPDICSEEDFGWHYSNWFFPGWRISRSLQNYPVTAVSADGLFTHSNNVRITGLHYSEIRPPVKSRIFIASGCWTAAERTMGKLLAKTYLNYCPDGAFIGCVSVLRGEMPRGAAESLCIALAQGKTVTQAIAMEHGKSYYHSIWHSDREDPWMVMGDPEMTLDKARELFNS